MSSQNRSNFVRLWTKLGITVLVKNKIFPTKKYLASSIADLEGAKFLNLTGLRCKYYLKSDDLK